MSIEEWAEKIKSVLNEAEADGYCVFGTGKHYDLSLMIGFPQPEDDDVFITDISI